MFHNKNQQSKCASAASAAAFSACANLYAIMDAALLASILFALIVLDLHILGVLDLHILGVLVLVVLVSILRITGKKIQQPASMA